jgi:hypothetical protein
MELLGSNRMDVKLDCAGIFDLIIIPGNVLQVVRPPADRTGWEDRVGSLDIQEV